MSDKIRVLIVDDSPLMREALKSVLSSDPSIVIIGMARDGKEGMEKAIALKPNVITMDLKMPIMSGFEAIEKIMEEFPIPIIVVSSMDVKVIMKALGVGAMDFVAITQEIEEIAKDLIEKVKIASKVRPLKRMKIKPPKPTKALRKKSISKVIAIGVSTGGPQALQLILSRLPPDFGASILVTQHISKGFIKGLAEWLKFSSPLDVRVARAGDVLKNATVLLAPDEYNTEINDKDVIGLSEATSKIAAHTPSIDIMMKSVAASYGEDAIGVIMTGMGRDGVEGVRAIKGVGGTTIAQDEKTSVIFGMNKIAIETGCVDKVVPLDKIADEIVKMV